MSEYDRLLSKIDAFNDVLRERKSHYTIYLFGSGLGIYHLKEDYRATQDLDYMSKEQISNQDTTMLLDMMDIHDMGGIMMVPELEDLKIVNEINYSNLTVKIPSIENFALSKLLSNRQKDYDDLKNYPILDNCNIKELKESDTIEYYKYSRSIEKALKKLGNYNYVSSDAASKSMENVTNNNSYFLIASVNYDYLMESTNLYSRDNYKIIGEFNVKEEIKKNNTIKNVYNIYINGLDFTGIMRDYNLIATVNLNTHKIVLTSIPRDYYIDVPAYNMKDTLMCLGSLDSEVSKEALEKLFDIKIDYTVNFNTTSLVNIVDAVNGVDFCSDYDFTTTHALVTNTYDDTKGKKLHVNKGCKTYNGTEILAIARERNAFPGRDRYRQKNCRQILINIAQKLASATTLTNYTEVLNSFDGLYTTDMNDKTVKSLIKSALENKNFEVVEQSVDGTDGIGIGHLGTQESWIMNPDMNTVNAATTEIKKVLSGK